MKNKVNKIYTITAVLALSMQSMAYADNYEDINITKINEIDLTDTSTEVGELRAWDTDLLVLDDNNDTIHLNEYEIMSKKYNSFMEKNRGKSVKQISEKYNLNEEEVNNIINYRQNYVEKINALSELSDVELKAFNYTQEQIYAIRNFDGSDEMLIRASSYVTVNMGFVNTLTTADSSSTTLISEFICHGIQSNWFSDIFAVTWSAPYKVKSSSGTVRYMSSYGDSSAYVKHSPRAGSVYALEMEFKKYIGGQTPKYVHSGSMIIDLIANTEVKDAAVYSAYGYSTVNLSPSVSYNGASISFSSGVYTKGTGYTYY